MKNKYKILIPILIITITILFYSINTFAGVMICDECCSGCALCSCDNSCKKLFKSKKYKFIRNIIGPPNTDCRIPPDFPSHLDLQMPPNN